MKQGTQDSVRTVDQFGNEHWRNADGKLHRLDGPATVTAAGTRAWFVDGKHHRTDGPAIVWADGSKWWYVDGVHHRTDGPAIERTDGTREWWVDGERVDMTLYIPGYDKEVWSSVRMNR